jgi:uncharacterized membrane protein
MIISVAMAKVNIVLIGQNMTIVVMDGKKGTKMIKEIFISCFILAIIVFTSIFAIARKWDRYEERKRNERTKKN